ncbi:short-chain dehydrogenase [Novosphingobium fuchskuhlense]|uniref:Short-chain dehydrogenase n=1 Tax=Novosphingobium fuchskuhlense TaxID=1117702 RepID=A0A117UZ26_9SPHN|nr:SDR family oxidoreductase [Novosphingobium fuchskuhlense]KUR73486.1 short-chain dehydrogenase [Novosphingobium fuchskuhlense]
MTIALDGVVALVTGATGGIGRAVCKALKAAHAVVIAADLPDAGADVPCDLYHSLDVTSAASWKALADVVAAHYGRLDALVHIAGISIVESFEATTLEAFHRLNAVNVDGVILGTQALLPLLREGGKARTSGASVVNFSSVGGINGAPFNAAYCTSKFALTGLTKCMGAEFAALGYNIRVNSVHPGGVDTGMLGSIIDRYVEMGVAPSREAAMEGIKMTHPIGRMARPEEMGGGVVFLCSDAASYMTCSELVIDGGFTQI